MTKTISKGILNLLGWKIGPIKGIEIPKCVICVAPHTSNWDFVIGKLFYTAVGGNARFLIKKEWFFFPFNLLFKSLGGVPIDRGKRSSTTEQMVSLFHNSENFQLAVTPEGTRKPVNEWKKGFYFIAIKANVPILIAYLDYGKKEVGIKDIFYPTGNTDEDIKIIRSYYKGTKGYHPDSFRSI